MFQVKFVRNPLAEPDPHKWLAEIVKAEAPKIKKQLENGVKRFILVTNIPGTAHPDSGSIDRVDQILREWIGIPAVCLWRNDLNRRLESAWDLKWAYPELMTGPDLIRYIVENNLSESKERRGMALRAFMAYQFKTDESVKFKQVDLNNKLLDLFIDVPIRRRFPTHWIQSKH